MTNGWPYLFLLILLIAVASWRPLFDLIQINPNLSGKTSPGPREPVQVLGFEKHCGLRQACPNNSFSIFLSTGSSPDNRPNLCVNGRYVIKPVDRTEGRGLNAAIVEPNSFDVVSTRNFDTYSQNRSVEIADWLETAQPDDIIIIFTCDEASSKMGDETRALLNDLGSGKIQNLQYRSQWYMITQKGARAGFTSYEKLTYSKKKNWGEKIEFRGCIPRRIPMKNTTADEPLKENKRRQQFCEGKSEDRYKGFCNEARFEIIMPALLTNKSLVKNVAYTLPIYLYASSDLEILIASLDSLIHQPGIVMSLVTILYADNLSDVPGLAKIYGAQCNRTEFSNTFDGKLVQARSIVRKFRPSDKYLIVIDSDVIPSPDFLFYMAQIVPIVERDEDVSVISGWSPNCYRNEGNVHVAYRIHGSPKYAALITSGEDRTDFRGELFAPDVARVQGPETCHLPSLDQGNWIDRPQDLLKSRYFHKMVMLQQLSQTVDADDVLSTCSQSPVKNETNAIYIGSGDESVKEKVLNCLGVVNNQYGEYEGIVRLLVDGKTVLVITSESSFYKSRPIVSI